MNFKQRFAYYLIGLLIGGFGVFYFLSAKAESRGVSFCYLPNCRVLKDIRTKPFHYSDDVSAQLANQTIDTTDIKNTLTYGDVDFSRSNVKEGAAKRYIIKGKKQNQDLIELEVLNYPDKAILVSIK